MRAILLLIIVVLLYQAVKTIVRSAVAAYHDQDNRRPRRIPGQEMVQDPNCRTYIVKERACIRRISGKTEYFCSNACADAYERSRRS